jgi:predicted RNA binding protein YcfA (HicA-like mRNA interferase family)
MTKLPAVSGARMIRALERAGFVVVRISGSHHRLVHPDDPRRATTVPTHGSKTMRSQTIRSILKQTGLTAEELINLL